jgi:hypothetical protein
LGLHPGFSACSSRLNAPTKLLKGEPSAEARMLVFLVVAERITTPV